MRNSVFTLRRVKSKKIVDSGIRNNLPTKHDLCTSSTIGPTGFCLEEVKSHPLTS